MFKKTKKIIVSFILIISIICLFTFPAFASTYSYSHDKLLTSDTNLYVNNGGDYLKKYPPTLCNNYDGYTTCHWMIKDYKPPSNSQKTNIYLRLTDLKGIYVPKGKRVTINFEIEHTGTVLTGLDTELYLNTRLFLKDISSTPRQNFGVLPLNTRTGATFIWDNTIKDTSIDLFQILLTSDDNLTISNSYYFETLYGNLTVDVSDIPVGAQDIIDNQNENTDKLIKHDEEMREQEKQETQETGEGSVDDVSSAIPSDNDGFISALERLSSSLVSSSTIAKWTFPRVYLPAISGIMEEKELISETEIDFNFWVNKIPSNILSLIRVLSTIALIIFCFKELYDTISYILTMRKGVEE